MCINIKNHTTLILVIMLSIVAFILALLLQYNKIGTSFSAIFVFIGAGFTALLNDHIKRSSEERTEFKEKLKEKLKEEKISIIICNILLLNVGISKGNIKIIESKNYNHLNVLTLGFLEMAINNLSFDERVGDEDIIKLMNISINTESINRNIHHREELIKKFNLTGDAVEHSIIKDNIIGLNKSLIKNSKNLIMQIEKYANS